MTSDRLTADLAFIGHMCHASGRSVGPFERKDILGTSLQSECGGADGAWRHDFAAYVARPLDRDVAESLRFAAGLVSLKIEMAGPSMETWPTYWSG